MTRWLIHSNHPKVHSGYGRQCAALARILAWLYGRQNVAISAFYGIQGFMDEWEGMPVYPGGKDRYGGDVVGMHATHFGADIIVCLMDNWALQQATLLGKNHVAWTPIDVDNPANPAATLGMHDTARLAENPATYVVPMSRFGYDVVQRAKEALKLPNPVGYLPHFIDCDTFSPAPPLPGGQEFDRAAVRAAMQLDDRFAVLMTAANRDQSRKNWPRQFEAFRRFHVKHPDSALILHTDESDPHGLNLRRMADRIGLPAGSYRFSAQYLQAIGMIGEAQLAGSMVVADVALQATCAEGFGLPIAETLACGTPVITTRGSSMTEVVGKGGWAVPAEKLWAVGHEAWWRMPSEDHLVRALTEAYARGQAYTAKKNAARPHVLDNFETNLVIDTHLRPLLKRLHDHFGLEDDARA